ncbi:MAG: hypothetical protein NT051_04860 [Candidatus Micrarchaeota archaeon]|nr:hypothetical protein [Candidatus Micrarchaeota archaeon]
MCGLVAKEAAHEIGKVCHRLGAIPVFIGKEVSVTDLREDGGRYSFHSRFHGKAYSVSLAAGGEFQVSNACAALAACSLLSASRGAIEEGLAKAAPKFRFWKISSSPLVIADCAHNPEAACALANEVAKISVQGKRVLLFSAMKDKEYAKNLLMLAPEFESLVITEVALERGASLKALASAARRVGGAIRIKSAKRALSLAKKRAGRQGLVVIAGSIYLLAELFGKDEKVCGQAFSALESKFQYNKIRIAQ